MIRRGLQLSILMVLLCVCVSAWATTSYVADGPMLQTQEILRSANTIVTGTGDRDAKLLQLKELLRDFLDTDALGTSSMGSHLDDVTSQQRQRFLALFRDLFVRTYVQRLLLFDVPEFAYGDERLDGETAEVETDIVTERDRFSVDYDLKKTKAGWAVTDIRIEDVSLGANFRSQFDRALSKNSFDGLMDKLARKLHGQNSAAK
jgi:ABC-type transporter MlaC component